MVESGRELLRWRWAVALLVVVAVACSWLPGMESKANAQIDAGFKRALVAFAAARTLNAVISVIQETEVTVQPFGLGVKLAPGQLLDPVNDLVENFADVMMMATIAFGIQKTLLLIFADESVSWAVTGLACIWLALYFARGAPVLLTRLLAMLLVMRFAFPVVAIAGEVIHDRLLKPAYDESSKVVQGATASVTQLQTEIETGKTPLNRAEQQSSPRPAQPNVAPAAGKDSKGLIETMKEWTRDATEAVVGKVGNVFAWPGDKVKEFRQKVADVRDSLETAAEHMVRMMAIFVVETVILPIGLLWLMVSLAGRSAALPGLGHRARP